MKNKIKIMTYNVLRGFHNKGILNKKRLNAAIKVVKNENPDILCVNEADYAFPNPTGKFLDYKKLLGFKYIFVASVKSYKSNLILSQIPIEKVKSIKMRYLDGLIAKFVVNNKAFGVTLIHTGYLDRDKNIISDMKEVLRKISRRHILTGDFNSLSDQDNIDEKALRKVIKQVNPEFYKENILAMLDRRFIPWLRRKGLTDVMKEFDDGYTLPTDLIDKEKTSAVRLDYFFTTKTIKTTGANVVRGKEAEQASDHYPIVMEIEV